MKRIWISSFLGGTLLFTYFAYRSQSITNKNVIHNYLVVDTEKKVTSKNEVVVPRNPVIGNPPVVPAGIYDINAGPSFSNYRLSSEPKTDLEIIRYLLISYQLRVKNNDSNIPTGTNREITKQLTGDNPSEVIFIEKNDPSIRNGKIIDRWGSPLFFHAVSSKSCDIVSAGPDGMRGTFDDLVEKGPEKINYCSDQN
jgi:hypothetical protein